jgi:hypothetical protein
MPQTQIISQELINENPQYVVKDGAAVYYTSGSLVSSHNALFDLSKYSHSHDRVIDFAILGEINVGILVGFDEDVNIRAQGETCEINLENQAKTAVGI